MMAGKHQKLLVQNNQSLLLEMIELWLWLLIMLLINSLVVMKEFGSHFVSPSQYCSNLVVSFVLSCKLFLVMLENWCIANSVYY
jgi:hypothetical protein